MKRLKLLLFSFPVLLMWCFIVVILISCEQHKKPEQATLVVDTSKISVTVKDTTSVDEDEVKVGLLKRLDSLRGAVLKLANENKSKPDLKGRIDGDTNVFVTYSMGNIFSSDNKHLLVKKFITGINIYDELYSDIYLLTNNQFKKVVTDTLDYCYTGDTLLDVNNDGYRDYSVTFYSGVGCCPRDSWTTYLYNKEDGGFKQVLFFNPEFNYKQKIVYESDYGYPGDVTLFKYRWKGLEKVLVESVVPTRVNYKIDSLVRPYSFTQVTYPDERRKIIRAVPDEYKKLNMYEYFISYQK